MQEIKSMYVKETTYNQSTTKVTRYRWVVMAILAVFYTLVYADRANIGVVLPLIQSEFKLSNLQAGSLASMFFVGYAITQIPAGFWYSKFGVRGLLSIALVLTSVFTSLIGTARSAAMIKLYRAGLGMAEGPCPVASRQPPTTGSRLMKKDRFVVFTSGVWCSGLAPSTL
ncbi:MAG: MFS transporter [Candidatus Korobacteraceae bacterium]